MVRDGREEERLDREAKRQLERFKEVNEESKESPGRKENSKRTKWKSLKQTFNVDERRLGEVESF